MGRCQDLKLDSSEKPVIVLQCKVKNQTHIYGKPQNGLAATPPLLTLQFCAYHHKKAALYV